jgi:hypothetical protein
MQLISLSLSHWNFYFPVTGKKITGDGEDLNITPSLKGVWVNEILDEPTISDSELCTAWDHFIENLSNDENKEDDEYLDDSTIDTFFRNYPAPNWIAFRIQAGTASFNETTWFILDMDTHNE